MGKGERWVKGGQGHDPRLKFTNVGRYENRLFEKLMYVGLLIACQYRLDIIALTEKKQGNCSTNPGDS